MAQLWNVVPDSAFTTIKRSYMQKRIWYVLQNSIRKVEYNEQCLKVPLFFGPRTSLCMYTLMSTMLHKYGREEHYDTNRQSTTVSLDFLTNKKFCIALVVTNEEKKIQQSRVHTSITYRGEKGVEWRYFHVSACTQPANTVTWKTRWKKVEQTSKNSQPIHSYGINQWTRVSTVKGCPLVFRTNNVIALKISLIRLYL